MHELYAPATGLVFVEEFHPPAQSIDVPRHLTDGRGRARISAKPNGGTIVQLQFRSQATYYPDADGGRGTYPVFGLDFCLALSEDISPDEGKWRAIRLDSVSRGFQSFCSVRFLEDASESLLGLELEILPRKPNCQISVTATASGENGSRFRFVLKAQLAWLKIPAPVGQESMTIDQDVEEPFDTTLIGLSLGYNPALTDACLIPFQKEIFRKISLDRTSITGRTLSSFRSPHRTRFANFRDTCLDDLGFSNLAKFTQLEHLDCWDSPVGDAALPTLNRMRALTYLDMRGTNLTGKGFGEVDTGLPVRTIKLCRCPILASYLPEIGRLKHLRGLDLSTCGLSYSELLPVIPALRRLETLNLIDNPIAEAEFEDIQAKLPDTQVFRARRKVT
jgi:hypothetical protein